MKNIWHNQSFKLALIFIFSVAIFAFLLSGNGISDADAFYHAKTASLMSQGDLIFEHFDWMQFSTLKNNFTDHHFFYHLILIPFVALFNPLIGVKIATVMLSSLMITVLAWFCQKFNLKYFWLVPVLFFTTTPLVFRYSLVKANSISIIILTFLLYFLIKKRNLWLFFLSIIYVWSYGGWMLGLVIAGLYFVAQAIEAKKNNEKIFTFEKIKPLLIIGAGNICGLIINPYFPQNLDFYWQQLVQIGVINYQDSILVGNEWHGLSLIDLPSLFICPTGILFLLALIYFAFNYKKQNALNWFLALSSIFFLATTIKSARYLEYFFIFAILFIVFIAAHLLKSFNFNLNKKRLGLAAVVFLLLLSFSLTTNYKNLNAINYNFFAGAGQYLQENTPTGAFVFHTRWDEWPMLFYQNTHNNYIAGLDPTFSYLYNSELYLAWQNMLEDDSDFDLQTIKTDFGADYILVNKEFENFDNEISASSLFELLYEDDEAKIFLVK